MPVQCTCQRCGMPFLVKPRRAATARFCSRACRGVPSPVRQCARCSTSFPYRRSRLKERPGHRTFCSRPCRDAGPLPPPPIISADGLTARVSLLSRDGALQGYALIDADDAAWAGQWAWRLVGTYAARSARVNGQKVGYIMHRELLGLSAGDGLEGDHLNRDRLDNRRSNLRTIPKAGRPNAQNTPSRQGASSRYRGVSWMKKLGKWRAEVRSGDTLHYLGLFADEQDAAEAAREARRRLMPYAVD